MELKLHERHLGMLTQHCEQLQEFTQNFDDDGRMMNGQFCSPYARSRTPVSNPGSQEPSHVSPGMAVNPLRVGARKLVLRTKVARKLLRNKVESGEPSEQTDTTSTASMEPTHTPPQGGSGSVGRGGSVGSEGLSPTSKAIKQDGMHEMMTAWRKRRALWGWQRMMGSTQVSKELTELATDQWRLNIRLGYFLAFLEYAEIRKERCKKKKKAQAAKEAKAAGRDPPPGTPTAPPRTPGSVAGRVKRDPRPTMTRRQRLEADKLSGSKSQSAGMGSFSSRTRTRTTTTA